MARTARQFPQGKFTLRTPKQTNNGHTEYVIYIYYYWQERQLRCSTDLSVNRSDWNQNANNGVGELRYHLHPEASFYGEVEGESMRDAFHGIVNFSKHGLLSNTTFLIAFICIIVFWIVMWYFVGISPKQQGREE